MVRDGNFCGICNIWPDEGLEEHYKKEHGIKEEDLKLDEEDTKSLKIYVRLVDYQYDSTTIQLVTLDMEKAFNFVPLPDHAFNTEIQVYQDDKLIEEWTWRDNSHSFVKTWSNK